MKKITITVDDTTLANLEILRHYYPYSNNSALIRRAIERLEESIRLTGGYDDAVRKYRENHPERGSGA